MEQSEKDIASEITDILMKCYHAIWDRDTTEEEIDNIHTELKKACRLIHNWLWEDAHIYLSALASPEIKEKWPTWPIFVNMVLLQYIILMIHNELEDDDQTEEDNSLKKLFTFNE